MGSALVPIVMLGWVPLVIALFAAVTPRRAVIAAFVIAWLFLPVVGYKILGLPDYTKMSATCLGVVLGILIFDSRRLVSIPFSWIDLPMLIWCLCPMASSVSNGLGMYDGMSEVISQTAVWGIPYYVGRLYFRTLSDLRELAIGLFLGGLVYVPLCLFEIRMSPQLHNWVYGFRIHSFGATYRLGGWRPTVFMDHGLMVGMWMCMTALLSLWMWSSRALPATLARLPVGWAVAALFVTAVLCKSAGALILLLAGVGAWAAFRVLRTEVVIWLLVAAAPVYSTMRMVDAWDGSHLVSWSSELIDIDRAASLQERLDNEQRLIDKALQQPVFGWGGWGRSRVYDEFGRDISLTDGLWVIALGAHGLLGWASLSLAMLVPPSLALRRSRTRAWRGPASCIAPAVATMLLLYWIDCVPNAMVNPVFTLALGALASVSCFLTGGTEQWQLNQQETAHAR